MRQPETAAWSEVLAALVGESLFRGDPKNEWLGLATDYDCPWVFGLFKTNGIEFDPHVYVKRLAGAPILSTCLVLQFIVRECREFDINHTWQIIDDHGSTVTESFLTLTARTSGWAVGQFVKLGASLSTPEAFTAFFTLLEMEVLGGMRVFINNGFSMTSVDALGWPILHRFLRRKIGTEIGLQWLIDNGVDLNEPVGERAQTPLSLAIMYGWPESALQSMPELDKQGGLLLKRRILTT